MHCGKISSIENGRLIVGSFILPVPLQRPQSTEISGLSMEHPAVIFPSAQSGQLSSSGSVSPLFAVVRGVATQPNASHPSMSHSSGQDSQRGFETPASTAPQCQHESSAVARGRSARAFHCSALVVLMV